MNGCSDPAPTIAAPFVEVAPDARLTDRRGTLTYRVPVGLDADLDVGQLIWVPLRHKLTLGIVVERHARPPVAGFEVRELHALVEPTFCLTPVQWQLAVWIAEETVCTLFEAASPMLPPGVGSRAVEHLVLRHDVADDERAALTPAQRRLVELLDAEGEIPLERAQRALGSSLTSVVPALEELGVLRRIARVKHRPPEDEPVTLRVRLLPGGDPPAERAPKQLEAWSWLSPRLRARVDRALPLEGILRSSGIERATLRALEDRGLIAIEPLPVEASVDAAGARVQLTDEQLAAWQQLREALRAERPGRVLLHGVTGSGKTELYLRAAAETLALGRSVVVLVPEIALSGQIATRFRERFGSRAIVLHSALSDRERARNWRRSAGDEPLVVVGPRSALFAPLADVGVVVVDEEHDASYKQDTVPRYHARAVATKLAQLHRALLVLGSATPDVETYRASQRPGWQRLELRERVGQRVVDESGQTVGMPIALPEARVVDMRAELRTGNDHLFSRQLLDVIDDRLAARQQVILFLNRRGASTFVQCRSCGTVTSCPYCDIPLVWHRQNDRMVCHRCGHRAPPPRRCRECGSEAIGYYGTGTQRVETEIQARFPAARVLRWDQDALRGKVTHEGLLQRVLRHEVDIIVGTQMIAKGLDLPDVTAVGVVNADTWLYLPDIRAAERTFQMLTQVAGRAGRRAAGGEVIFQTYSPAHYAIAAAAKHDYAAFYREEIAFRREHGYPPFKRLARLLYRHADEDRARAEAEAMAEQLTRALVARPEIEGVDIIGPAPAFSARVRGLYGWQLLVRGDQLVALLASIDIHPGWAIDVDPVSLL